MKHYFGLDQYHFNQKKQQIPITLDTSQLINGHTLLCGMSGVGKSYQLRAMIASAQRSGIQVEVFDPHDELDIPGSKTAKYSEATRYGYNPLALNPDPHSGGVRKRINWLLTLLNSTSRKLGPKQETALRYLLQDIYYLNGCYEDKPSSWGKKHITEAQRAAYLGQNNYIALKQFYPTLGDLITYAERKIKALYLGANSPAITNLDKVNKMTAKLRRLVGQLEKVSDDDEAMKLEEKLEDLKHDAISAYSDYVHSIETGREITDVIKYNSKDVLQSVFERLKNLDASGIFRPNPPPFGNAQVRVHQMKSLSDDEQRLLVQLRLEELFRTRRDQPTVNDVQQIVVIDEAHKFADEEGDNLLNILAKEGRKFGMGLWCASQSPTHFSEDFLTNCGTTILLGIHTTYWDGACRKLKIDESILRFIKPHHVAALKFQRKAETNARFHNVILSQPMPTQLHA